MVTCLSLASLQSETEGALVPTGGEREPPSQRTVS